MKQDDTRDASTTDLVPVGGSNLVARSAGLVRRGMEALQQPRGRMVQFPSRWIGICYLMAPKDGNMVPDPDSKTWAQGAVYVPAGRALDLRIPRDDYNYRFAGLPLQTLRPDDIYSLSYFSRNEPGGWLPDSDLAQLRALTGLRELWLQGKRITDAGLACVEEMNRLQKLWLNYEACTGRVARYLVNKNALEDLTLRMPSVGEEDLEAISALGNLRTLRLQYERTTGTGFACLGALSNLEELYVCSDGLRDTDLKVLRVLPRLRTLRLRSRRITNEALKYLRPLSGLTDLSVSGGASPRGITTLDLMQPCEFTRLDLLDLSWNFYLAGGWEALVGLLIRELDLFQTGLDDRGVIHVARILNLRKLSCSLTLVTDGEIAALARLETLEELDLSYTRITDATLDTLCGHHSLRKLYLAHTNTTARGAERLCDAIPQLLLYANGCTGGNRDWWRASSQ